MKILTKEEFNERVGAVAEAQIIFIGSGLTNSVDLAWELYRDILAEKEFAVRITSDMEKQFNENPFDKYPRPKCPECGTDMYFRKVPDNPEGIKTQLVCVNDKCDTVLNSDKSLDEWLEVIKDGSV